MGKTVEIWTSGAGVPVAGVRQAVRAEANGFDGIVYVDSQNLVGDCYIALALAATETSRLKLGTGVTNPYTRHPAVAASAIATVQAISGGRAFLGIGRGDSALAHLGLAPVPVGVLEEFLRRLQGYLRGEEVPFEDGANVDSLQLANRPTGSRIEWLRPTQAKVPVDVAATGPKVIRMAARLADRVSLAVGADLGRLRWGIETARKARVAAGMDPEGVAFGAYVSVVAHPDASVAKQVGEGGVSLFARFSAMHGRVVGPASDEQRRVLEAVHDAYDMTTHSQAGSPQAAVITEEFASQFAILGPPGLCGERLAEIVALGIDRLVIVGPSQGADRNQAAAAQACFVEEVMPALRERVAAG